MDFQQIRTRVQEIIGAQSAVKAMFKDLADMYWISETDTGIGNSSRSPFYNKAALGDQVRVTASTSSRDRVTGLHRMIRTSKPQFKVACRNQEYADKIEKALDAWWQKSNEGRRATIESELSLSGVLFSDMNMAVTAVDDQITELEKATTEEQANPYAKRRLKKLQDRRAATPIWFDVNSPIVTYPVWGDGELGEHVLASTMKGKEIREKWGIDGLDNEKSYTLYDYWDVVYRCAYVDGLTDPILGPDEHGLERIPRFSAVADGTDLFPEENRKRQPFLYGMWKSGLAKREDEVMTTLFTSIIARGLGGLLVIDTSKAEYQPESVRINYAGLQRYIEVAGGAQLIDDKAYDKAILEAIQLINTIGQQTTIPSQTLGENISSGTPYSGYAMASQNGRIPIIPIQEGVVKVIKDGATYALRYFKQAGMEWEGLKPSEILDDFELTVTLEVDLPQDALRNAQTVAQLKNAGVPLSAEWIHNFLQIKDSGKMTFDVLTEQATSAAFQQDLPNLVQQMLSVMSGGGTPPTPGEQPQPGEQTPPMPDEAAMQYAQMQGGPEAAMAGGAVMPATEPMDVEQIMKARG